MALCTGTVLNHGGGALGMHTENSFLRLSQTWMASLPLPPQSQKNNTYRAFWEETYPLHTEWKMFINS